MGVAQFNPCRPCCEEETPEPGLSGYLMIAGDFGAGKLPCCNNVPETLYATVDGCGDSPIEIELTLQPGGEWIGNDPTCELLITLFCNGVVEYGLEVGCFSGFSTFVGATAPISCQPLEVQFTNIPFVLDCLTNPCECEDMTITITED